MQLKVNDLEKELAQEKFLSNSKIQELVTENHTLKTSLESQDHLIELSEKYTNLLKNRAESLSQEKFQSNTKIQEFNTENNTLKTNMESNR